jgi:hypothetical protein
MPRLLPVASSMRLDEHEFDVNGQIVADIGGHAGVPDRSGAVDVRIEALTIAA